MSTASLQRSVTEQAAVVKRNFSPLVATLFVIAVNAAANIVPINGYNTGELSALNPTGFTPSGYVFGIWSLIYLGLIAFGIAVLRGGSNIAARVTGIHGPYLLNAAANAGWIFAWHYRQVALSLALMLVILATLIQIFWRLRAMPRPSWSEFLSIDGPFSLYFGWITTATLANFGALCFELQWYPLELSMDQWALVTVCTATAIYVWMGAVTRDVVYCAVFVWAAIGIYNRPSGVLESVRIAALTGAFVVSICIIWMFLMRRSSIAQKRFTET
jgi:translocator protein